MKIKKLFIIVGLSMFLSLQYMKNYTFDNTNYVFAEQIKEETDISTVINIDKNINLHAKSVYLMESSTKTCCFSKEETKRLPIASMCKVMTLILCFDAIKRGEISFDDEICASQNASSMGGSQVFLEAGGKYKVSELMKSIVVCSANDSCVAMAEKIAGSEANFVDLMNDRAKEIGANDTLFANCTGLPKETQYSCAKDVALMFNELISNEEYFNFSKVWMHRFIHPQGRFTDISNTNKLIRFYDGCDGGKTGFTSEAGFCLVATAKRGLMRVISVVIGEDSSAHRFEDSKSLFDYAFSSYSIKILIDSNNPLTEQVSVRCGNKDVISVKPERNSNLFSLKNEKSEFSMEIILPKSVKAPVVYGDKIGEIIVYKDQVEYDRVPLVANETVKKANFINRFRIISNNWN